MTDADILAAAERVSHKIVYTIHTPVKAGHDRFSRDLYSAISHKAFQRILNLLAHDEEANHEYNFTAMAMRINRAINSVSRLHRDVTKKQFPAFSQKIKAITNGVHHLTWISDNRGACFDQIPCLQNWRNDPGCFVTLSDQDQPQLAKLLQEAWNHDNLLLIKYVNAMLKSHRAQMIETWIDPPNFLSSLPETDWLKPGVFTIGFARRFSTYKRADLIFDDIGRLSDILINNNWPVNFLFAGKAHPADEPGKSVLKLILDNQEELYVRSNGLGKLIFIPGYDMGVAKLMVAGVHTWLNSPKRPLEASGTSGMKAAMNGVPNISIMDGWWVEGYHDGQTGWKFGHEGSVDEADLSEAPDSLLYMEDANAFYELLPLVLKMYYTQPEMFLSRAINNLRLNIPIFNTHRMAAEYVRQYGLQLDPQVQTKIDRFCRLYQSEQATE
jgi:starch phosphorylase